MVFTFYGLGKLLFSYLSLSRSMKPIAPYKYPSISLKLLFKKWISQQYEVLQVEKKFIPTFAKILCTFIFTLFYLPQHCRLFMDTVCAILFSHL